MKLPVFNQVKKKVSEREMPSQFSEEYRPDLIRRAVHAIQSAARQNYGASPLAGFRHSSKVSKRRRDYRGCYGFGISRVNRKILSKRGTRMFWEGTFSPQTTGGRRAHPPHAEKDLDKKINKKENRKAIRSAIAATINKIVVLERGHKVPADYPFLLDASFEKENQTKEVIKTLESLGFEEDLERAEVKKVRAGVGKNRGRKYQRRKGLLIVVGETCPLLKSARNIPGVDVVTVKGLNAELLAPGAKAGRATIWTEPAIENLKSLFN